MSEIGDGIQIARDAGIQWVPGEQFETLEIAEPPLAVTLRVLRDAHVSAFFHLEGVWISGFVTDVSEDGRRAEIDADDLFYAIDVDRLVAVQMRKKRTS